jgi:uncharacterized protein with HEPN domain
VRHDRQRLDDVLVAAAAIAGHMTRGSLDDGLVFDAVRVRLIEIGEAVEDIDPGLLANEPAIPWRDVAGMRDHRRGHASPVPSSLEPLQPTTRRWCGSSVQIVT